MSSAVQKTSKYSYRSTGGGNADVSIEYSADLSALSRLEVKDKSNLKDFQNKSYFMQEKKIVICYIIY